MRAVLALSLVAASLAAQAASDAPPRERLSLAASASAEVTRDILGVTFSTSREGADAAGVQSALKQALDAALAEARKVARPGQVDVQTGGFSLAPRYDPKSGKINGWQGSAELMVEGRDATAIAQLAGRIGTLTIARVGYSLSREAREKAESDISAQAIGRFRAKAADYARQFGYGGYVLGEVNVSSDEPGPRPVMALMRAKAAPMADEALPTEAGKATVTVNVNGSVQLTREAAPR
ncbi:MULTISPECIES: SIMPL domain-containing protein [Roseateles]|uniref:SIMPL domain-containing protein n=1 Tax=Pelomonas caseinilytica TaxID=2906763 RepID=A0ABS8X8T5_9BURK|nr:MULTISPECIES: SIMPL domain-containing protein [unclassified Roseateles]MCE4535895.1 SIMPL domain-containing protein [Pelomonas sp. P7]HEV6968921.1 SIMPL domain-containing protein [Roseateles sp.]